MNSRSSLPSSFANARSLALESLPPRSASVPTAASSVVPPYLVTSAQSSALQTISHNNIEGRRDDPKLRSTDSTHSAFAPVKHQDTTELESVLARRRASRSGSAGSVEAADDEATDVRIRQCKQMLAAQNVTLIEKEAAIGSLERKVEQLREKLSEERKKREEAEGRVKKMQGEVDDKSVWWAEERRKLEQDLEKARATIDELQNEVLKVKTQEGITVASLHSMVEEKEVQRIRAQDAVDRLEREICAMRRKVQEKSEGNKALIEAMNSAEARTRAEREMERSVNATAVRELRSLADSRMEVISQLQAANEQITADLRQLREDLQRTQDIASEKAAQLKSLEGSVEAREAAVRRECESKVQQYEAKMEAMVSRMSEASRLAQSHEASAKTMSKQWEAEHAGKQELLHETQRLRKQLKDQEVRYLERVGVLEAKVEELRSEIDRMEADRVDKERQKHDMETQYRAVLSRKEDERRQLEEDILIMNQLLPQGPGEKAADQLYAREAMIRSILTHALSDLLWINRVIKSFLAGQVPELCNTESDVEQEARTAGKHNDEVAGMLQNAMDTLLASVQTVIATQRPHHSTAEGRRASSVSEDCVVM